MQIVPFIAESAEDAVAQIRKKLGPDAVVVNVRQLPADGLSRLWKSPRIEVLAYQPEAAPSPVPASAVDPLQELKQELQALRSQLGPAAPQGIPPGAAPGTARRTAAPRGARSAGEACWRVGEVLEGSGLLPVNAHRVVEQLRTVHGDQPPGSLPEEMLMTRAALNGLWRTAPEAESRDSRPHVLIGPPGVGKSTCICKWLAQARLIEGRGAKVWRLDGARANTAEALSVYCEILGVPAERTWDQPALAGGDLAFVDLPGTEWRSPAGLEELRKTLAVLGPCHVHLVLNAAYETPLLLAQARAFAPLAVEDVILTHLDEEPRWGKIWNIVLGTNYPVRYLSAAQNVPGDFFPATAERILARQFHG